MTLPERNSVMIIVLGVTTLVIALFVLAFGVVVEGSVTPEADDVTTAGQLGASPLPERPAPPTSTPRGALVVPPDAEATATANLEGILPTATLEGEVPIDEPPVDQPTDPLPTPIELPPVDETPEPGVIPSPSATLPLGPGITPPPAITPSLVVPPQPGITPPPGTTPPPGITPAPTQTRPGTLPTTTTQPGIPPTPSRPAATPQPPVAPTQPGG
ncbi:MAG TPA: hypothetical protein VF707_04215, partial [Ardenticatenaceae bacterium]